MLHATIHSARREAPTNLLPLTITFEVAAAALEVLPRMFFEPDGSFVWVGETDAGRWQLDGQLQDRGPTLDHVEIKGTCAPEPFAQFLAALRGNAELLVFQQVQAGELLDESAAVGLLG